jgi:hypothetical protein
LKKQEEEKKEDKEGGIIPILERWTAWGTAGKAKKDNWKCKLCGRCTICKVEH